MNACVTVIIPTQRRLEGLRRAVRSVLGQDGFCPQSLEILIVDNDAWPSARLAVESLRHDAPGWTLRYVHEPEPGVASARNAAMALVTTPLVAFLDDDEEAAEIWLQELVRVQKDFAADVVFGPIRGRAPAGTPHKAFLEAFFSRIGPGEDGLTERLFGCGNSLIRRAVLPNPTAPFNRDYDARGGEDDFLFRELRDRGAKFAWAAAALAFEDPAPDRLTLAYAAPRAFAYGQGGTQFRARFGSPALIAWSMGTGLAQAVVYGAAAVLAFLFRIDGRAFVLDRAARGLGKVFWGAPFHIQFYGRAAPAGAPAPSPAPSAALTSQSALAGDRPAAG